MSATIPSEAILDASRVLSQRLQDALAHPDLYIFKHSHWRCLAWSYSSVIQALAALLERACSSLRPPEQEIMCHRLSRPLKDLLEAVEEGERCMQEAILPSSSSQVHLWLVEKALKACMSTEVVDVHLRHLLWVSSVVREQIMRFTEIDDMELVLSNETRELCEIWEHVDAQDDFVRAESLLSRIMSEAEEEPHQELASFILQKLSYFEKGHRLKDFSHLPPFLWVEPADLKRKVDPIGMGGYSKVHEALWLGGRFAVKDFYYVKDDWVFGREAMIQAQVHHPNVTSLVCCTKTLSSRRCSLVMELMQEDLGTFLEKRTKNSPLPLLFSLDLMLQIAQGMEYLHSDSVRVIHRDLKPFNILVSFLHGSFTSPDLRPHVHLKIADFGMSKAKIASTRYTTRPIGTLQYRAPEVSFAYEMESGSDVPTTRYSNKVDVYSFGMVCYEILTGRAPFEGHGIGKRVMAGERPMLPTVYPPALSTYIQLCWHAKPEMRPSFKEICMVLRYFKACVLLKDLGHDQDVSEYHNWLSHPLSTATCAHMCDMIQDVVMRSGYVPRPHLLIIPLEMFCCRVVLQQFGGKTGSRMTANWSRKSDVIRASNQITGGWPDIMQNVSSVDMQHVLINSEIGDTHGTVAEFPYEELRKATKNFSYVLENSSSQEVFLGMLLGGRRIAVKVARQLGQNNFWRNLVIARGMADKLRHPNIVALCGWCRDRGDLLLVYEYMPNGDLGVHMHGGVEGPVLGWQQRYNVVCQVAAALQHLHQDWGSNNMQIVHGNVKSDNVLLDAEWNARLGGCGQAVLEGDEGRLSEDDVTGAVGYRLGSKVVSRALDIYSFGVMMIEVACGGSMGDTAVEWVQGLYRVRKLMQAADARLEGNFDKWEMERVLELSVACTNERLQERPSMEDVNRILSGASELPSPA